MNVDATQRSRDRRLLLAFMAAALALRLPGHLDSGLWYDEIWLLVESIRVPFRTLFTSFESDNNHPLYTVLAWLSVKAFGEHAWTLRLPALLFGVASIGMMWKLSITVASRAEATLATALLTVSYHHVWFSQNARGYTMLLFWTLAATYFLIRTYEGRGARGWVPYAVCMALATFTHASAVLVALAHALVAVVVVVARRRAAPAVPSPDAAGGSLDPFLGLVAAGGLSMLLHAGMLGDMLAFFTGSSAATTTAAQPEPAAVGPSQWTTLYWTVSAVVNSLGVPAPLGWAALLGVAALMGAGLVAWLRRSWVHTLLFVVPGFLAVAATTALGRSLRPRFLFHLGGFALLILVAGVFVTCDLVARRVPERRREAVGLRLRWAAAVVTIAASLLILPRAYTLPKQDFEGALDYALSRQREGAVIATVGLTVLPYRDFYETDFSVLRTEADLDALMDTSDTVLVLNTIPIFLEASDPDLAARLAAAPEVARFRGSLGDGDVVVLSFDR